MWNWDCLLMFTVFALGDTSRASAPSARSSVGLGSALPVVELERPLLAS